MDPICQEHINLDIILKLKLIWRFCSVWFVLKNKENKENIKNIFGFRFVFVFKKIEKT